MSAAPAAMHVSAAAASVAPDVITSSTNRICRPSAIPAWRGCTRSASDILANRASRPRPSCVGVCRRRCNRSGQCSNPASPANRADKSADWLYRRRSSRYQCSGTGTTSIPGRMIGPAARSNQSPIGRTRSCLSPCFSPSTIRRPLSRYSSAARPCAHGRAIIRHSSQWATDPSSAPGNGTPQVSQTIPPMNVVARQQTPHRPKSVVTCASHVRHCGG